MGDNQVVRNAWNRAFFGMALLPRSACASLQKRDPLWKEMPQMSAYPVVTHMFSWHPCDVNSISWCALCGQLLTWIYMGRLSRAGWFHTNVRQPHFWGHFWLCVRTWYIMLLHHGNVVLLTGVRVTLFSICAWQWIRTCNLETARWEGFFTSGFHFHVAKGRDWWLTFAAVLVRAWGRSEGNTVLSFLFGLQTQFGHLTCFNRLALKSADRVEHASYSYISVLWSWSPWCFHTDKLGRNFVWLKHHWLNEVCDGVTDLTRALSANGCICFVQTPGTWWWRWWSVSTPASHLVFPGWYEAVFGSVDSLTAKQTDTSHCIVMEIFSNMQKSFQTKTFK